MKEPEAEQVAAALMAFCARDDIESFDLLLKEANVTALGVRELGLIFDALCRAAINATRHHHHEHHHADAEGPLAAFPLQVARRQADDDATA